MSGADAPTLLLQLQAALAAGRLTEAEPLCAALCRRCPDNGDLWLTWGRIAGQLGRYAAAEPALRKAVELAPGSGEGWYLLGALLHAAGQSDAAIEPLRRALNCRPGDPNALTSLAEALQQTGALAEARECYQSVLDLQPENLPARYNLALVCRDQNRFREAASHLQLALRLSPDNPAVCNSLGYVLRELADPDDAEAYLRRAIALAPELAEAHYNLGTVLADRLQVVAAEASLREAARLKPELEDAHRNLGNALLAQGRLAEAEQCFRDALAADPQRRLAAGNLLLALHYTESHSPQSVFQEHAAWGATQSVEPACAQAPNPADAGRRLRIGYMSPDLRLHSVSYFARALVEHRNADQFEVFCYAEMKRPDAYTELFRNRVDGWRLTSGTDDDALAALIAGDGIDILVDLAGHTAGNRLGVFARRPAPVQITYLGYPDTTGLPTMDYRLTDFRADPVGEPPHTTETLVRLARPFLCYTPPEWAPPVNELPALRSAGVTFGSFNNLAKMSSHMTELWATLLHKVPDSQLILKTKSFRDPVLAERYRALFIDLGVAPDRLELIGWTNTAADHLLCYHRVDIALDTAPYNGTTTTCEALWMGVPVVTMVGATHAGRVGASLLHAVGLDHCIAQDPTAYLHTAVELASDLAGLSVLRARLREQMAASALCDGPGFAREMEKTYRQLWRDRCRGQPPAP